MSLGNFCSRLLSICMLLSILVIQVSFAQGSGTIKGQVLDQVTGESLVGANVTVENTSIGNAADLDGYFTLRLVPVGKWTLKVSYVGYKPVSMEVTVADNTIIEQNFRLLPQTIAGDEVIVTAQARGQVQAINQQLGSDKIANVVSEARIQELPDFNAAAAIGRLPGVSTLSSSGEANKVVIRGLAPQYNQITLGGVALASTGSTNIGASSQQGGASGQISTDRSVDISMISPYMIKSVSVYKSLTPDLNANAIGGTVNMELREAPSELHTDILWQSGYTEKSNTYGNYRGVASVSDRFFDDLLGVYVLGNAESYDRDADNMSAVYNVTNSKNIGANGYLPVQVRDVTLNRHIETRQRYGGNLILDFKLPSGSIKVVNMFSRLNSDYKDNRMVLQHASKVLNFTYREGKNSIDLGVNSIAFQYDLGILQMDLSAANTYSFNSLPKSPYLQFDQTGGIISTPTPENTRPEDLLGLLSYRGDSSIYLRQVSIFSSQYKENNQSYRANFKVPFNAGTDVSGYIKFGGEYRYDHRTNDQGTPFVELNTSQAFKQRYMDSLVYRFGVNYNAGTGLFSGASFTSKNSDLYKSFLDNRFGKFVWAVDPTIPIAMTDFIAGIPAFSGRASGTEIGGWFNGIYQQFANDYRYNEEYYAGYLMAEVNFFNTVIVGGVRYEKVKSDYLAYNMIDSRNPQAQSYYPVEAYPENEFWLPMVQVKYNINDWVDVRYAYTQSLARSDYHQLSPKFTMSYDANNVWAGNPDLRPAHAFNHDLIFTFHSNELGLLSIGGFYKTVKDFTYYTQYKLHTKGAPGLDSVGSFNPPPKDGAQLYTYVNSPDKAFVKGIEVDLQTRFWYLPFPLDGIVLGVNYTRITSKATYPWRDDRTYFPPRPLPSYTVVLDSTRSGRLISQPNDLVNAYIGYDYKGFSARASFIFQGNSVGSIGVFAETDGFTRDYFRIDASAKQVLPWAGIELFLDLNNINGETSTSAQQTIGGFTSEQNYGLTANLGVRFRL